MRLASRFSWIIWLCIASPGGAAENPQVVELWPGAVPDETGNLGAERSLMSPRLDRKQVEVTEPTRMVTNVSRPSITIYRPAKDKDTGTAVLVCPGGGYWNLYWQLELTAIDSAIHSRLPPAAVAVEAAVVQYRTSHSTCTRLAGQALPWRRALP